MEDGDVNRFIKVTSERLHYVAADDYLVLISEYQGNKNKSFLLREAIESIKDEYDFILIDTPPNLSIQTINA